MTALDLSSLSALGWGEPFASAFAPLEAEGLEPARVAVEHRNRYLVLTRDQEIDARLAGKLRHHLEQTGDRPVVGDWVAINREADGAIIHARLPRKSQFSRKAAGRTATEQVMAANVDTVFLASGLDSDLNPRRLERYLITARESGAMPVVILTKADLTEEAERMRAEIEAVSRGVPIHTVSSRSGAGIEELTPYLAPGRTIAVLGSSGVGKSTLINRLLGTDQLRTGDVRKDGRGRHTTTNRQLVRLPSGALIIDTPGLRELQLWEADTGLQEVFNDIEERAHNCKFADCSHSNEPQCAVRAAIEAGEIAPERLESFNRLRREIKHEDTRHDPRAQSQKSRADRSANKLLRKRLKEKDET